MNNTYYCHNVPIDSFLIKRIGEKNFYEYVESFREYCGCKWEYLKDNDVEWEYAINYLSEKYSHVLFEWKMSEEYLKELKYEEE